MKMTIIAVEANDDGECFILCWSVVVFMLILSVACSLLMVESMIIYFAKCDCCCIKHVLAYSFLSSNISTLFSHTPFASPTSLSSTAFTHSLILTL